jgi:predicted nucleic acid-binding protein
MPAGRRDAHRRHDLWIVATGIAYGMPIATRNAGDFRRVPGLEVLTS